MDQIENERITLSKYSLLDVVPIYQAIKNSYNEIAPWVSWLHSGYNQKDVEEFVNIQILNWNNNEEFSFTIKDKEYNVLGVINLHIFDQNNNVASIGYWMDTQFCRNGICTQALKLLVDNSFKYLNLNRIEVIVAVSNLASQRVAEKAGAEMESIQKKRVNPNGFPQDAKMYVFFPQK
jgi:RimJ/RimL family protein N-acetyltransferase